MTILCLLKKQSGAESVAQEQNVCLVFQRTWVQPPATPPAGGPVSERSDFIHLSMSLFCPCFWKMFAS